MQETGQEPRWQLPVATLAALGLLALAFGPLLGSLGERFLGSERVDAYGTHWFYWFVGRELARGEGFGHTNLFFFPFGKDIYAHTGANVLDAVLAQPFYAALGPVAGYNAFVVVALLVNGLASLPLMGQFAASRAARVFGAAIFALNPYLLFELTQGRPTQVFQPFLPLFFYHLLRFESAGWKHALWGALHLALTAFTYWFYAIFAGLVAVAHFAQRALLHPDRGRFFGRHALAALLSLAFVAPAALPLVTSTFEEETPGLLVEPSWPFLELETKTLEGVDIGLNVFQPALRANGFLIDQEDGSALFFADAVVLGIAQIVGIALGLALSRHRWVLGAMLGAALVLAVGHLVWTGAGAVPNPLYVLVVKIVPFMRRLWWPGRAMTIVGLLSGVLCAAGLGELARRRGPGLAFAVGLLVLGGAGYELKALGYLPFPTWSAEVPAGYRCLAQGPQGALIELPYARSQAHLYYQTAHGRPILGGMVEDNPVFTPTPQRALVRENGFLRLLLALANDASASGEYTEAEKAEVAALGYRYVVLQLQTYVRAARAASAKVDPMLGGQLGALMRRLTALLGAPVYADPDLLIFAPWGDPSPCADPGPGRSAWPTRQPEDGKARSKPLVVRGPEA